jgi:hypothetical protein
MRRALGGILVLAAALALSGCQGFFTTSLASFLARSSYNIPSNISNAEAAALIAANPNDPKLLASLMAVLNAQAAASVPGAKALAAAAAVGASGVSTTVAGDLTTAINGGGTPSADSIAAMVKTLQDAEVATPGIVTALSGLGNAGTLNAATLTASGLQPTQVVVAAMLLAANALPPGTTDPSSLSGEALTNFQNNSNVILAVQLVNSAASSLPAGSAGASLASNLAQYMNIQS